MDYWGVDVLWKWSLAGLGLMTREQATDELQQFDNYSYAQRHYREFRASWKKTLENSGPFEIRTSLLLP
jgi:hypothetical protein